MCAISSTVITDSLVAQGVYRVEIAGADQFLARNLTPAPLVTHAGPQTLTHKARAGRLGADAAERAEQYTGRRDGGAEATAE
jgi:hypothetical protein